MIPPQLAFVAAQYGTKILAVLILVASLVAGYYYWKHEVSSEARDQAIDDCNESRNKFRVEAEHFKLARAEEVDKINKLQSERVQNAIKTYIEHYESIRNTPTANSLRVKATCTASTSGGSVFREGQDRPEVAGGIGGTGTAELQAGNLRQLNKVIDDIERMELKCEQLLNSVE